MRLCLSTEFCCCYGHCYLFPSFVWLFFYVSLGKFEALSRHAATPYAVSVATLVHLTPVFLPLYLFSWDPALESETTLSIRPTKLSQGHPDPQFLPPLDKKLMSWHICEAGQTFKDQSGDLQLCYLPLLVSPAVMEDSSNGSSSVTDISFCISLI